jgi:hypothetical protein
LIFLFKVKQNIFVSLNYFLSLVHHVADESIQTSPERPPQRIDISTQTTPSLNLSSHRRFQTIEQQTTPIIPRSSTSQTSPVAIPIMQEIQQQQITPLHTKSVMHLRRNVRFQFTPSTDARLAAKEKSEDEQKHPKQDIIIDTNPQQIISDNEREEDTEDEITHTKKKIPIPKKKKNLPIIKNDDSSEETVCLFYSFPSYLLFIILFRMNHQFLEQLVIDLKKPMIHKSHRQLILKRKYQNVRLEMRIKFYR